MKTKTNDKTFKKPKGVDVKSKKGDKISDVLSALKSINNRIEKIEKNVSYLRDGDSVEDLQKKVYGFEGTREESVIGGVTVIRNTGDYGVFSATPNLCPVEYRLKYLGHQEIVVPNIGFRLKDSVSDFKNRIDKYESKPKWVKLFY